MAAYKKFFHLCTPSINNLNLLLNRINLGICYQQHATFNGRLIEQKYGIPPKPKRPLNPFLIFALEQRSKVLEENPSIHNSQILVKVSEKWSKCDAQIKQNLRQVYRLEMDEYVKQVLEYERNLTDEQRQLIKMAREKKLQTKQKSQMKSKLTDLGKPKKPPTGFLMFLLFKLETKKKDLKYTPWIKSVSEEWANMSYGDKEKYLSEGRKLMDNYKSELINWEEKMVKLGHVDLVRKQVLLGLKNKSTL